MNYHLFQIVNDTAGRNDLVDDVFEWSAMWLIYVLAAIAAIPVLAHVRHGRPALVRVVASLGLAFAVGQVVATLSTEVRPFQTHPVHQLIPHATGASLPSDHATAAFAVAFAVGAFLSRRWGVALSLVATIIGFARVWTGVHYPGDILAGALVAAAAVATIGVVGRAYDRRTSRRVTSA
ncbi:phosphatase PAP2 family protein [Micromonospora sp. NPDC004551]|uniref:phosphatase PAP2 family protein n=1 Tax=Micromonospora sp. NPDC004551 TaxID=3154284 RepID=UPI0033BE26CD